MSSNVVRSSASSASVDEILSRLNLSKRDLNNLSTSHLETIFTDLTSREIALLCRTSRKFERLCKDGSYLKNRVFNRHGIEKKYGDIWRETARKMDEINMINLNIKWVDGRTYREILDDALQNGANTLEGLSLQYLTPYVNDGDEEKVRYDFWDEEALQGYANTYLDKTYTNDEIDYILLNIYAREIDVIYNAVEAYQGKNGFLPGVFEGYNTNAYQSYKFLHEMIDPMLYVMQYSSFPRDQLGRA